MFRLLLLMTLSLLLTSAFVLAQSDSQSLPTPVQKAINAIFSEYDNTNGPGFAVGVVKNAALIFANGYGLANMDHDIPITPSSAFNLASVSKRFTGACIAMLILDKKLSLDDPASKYLPRLAKYEHEILVKHLLYNTSGLHEYYRQPRPEGYGWTPYRYFDIDYCIDIALKPDSLLFKPGEEWRYNNINFMLLAKIVEKVSGMPFAQFARERIFDPLDMSRTYVNDDVTMIIKNRVLGYNRRTADNARGWDAAGIKIRSEGDWIQIHRNSPHHGGSGMYSSIEDLAKWCINLHNKALGGQAFYDLMHTQLTFNHDRNNQAFGLYFSKYQGRTRVAWDGGDLGFSTEMVRFPDQGIAIICLSNLGSERASRRVAQIADILIENGLL